MTTALCLRCGAAKFGAFCRCSACGGLACPDQPLAIALSTHVLSTAAIARLGEVIRELAALTPDGDLRRAAFCMVLRERMPPQFHREISAKLEREAKALLARIQLPDALVTTTLGGARALPLPHAGQRRDLFWEQVIIEVRRNRALVLVGAAPKADEPDLVVEDLAAAGVRGIRDPVVEMTSGDETDPDRRRARYVISQIETRRGDLEALGASVVGAQAAYLAGELPRPAPVAFETICASLMRDIYHRRIASYLAVGRLACGDREYRLADLVARPVGALGRTRTRSRR